MNRLDQSHIFRSVKQVFFIPVFSSFTVGCLWVKVSPNCDWRFVFCKEVRLLLNSEIQFEQGVSFQYISCYLRIKCERVVKGCRPEDDRKCKKHVWIFKVFPSSVFWVLQINSLSFLEEGSERRQINSCWLNSSHLNIPLTWQVTSSACPEVQCFCPCVSNVG